MEVKPNIRTTIVCPGAVKTELREHITEADIQQANKEYVGAVGIGPDSFARVVAFAINIVRVDDAYFKVPGMSDGR